MARSTVVLDVEIPVGRHAEREYAARVVLEDLLGAEVGSVSARDVRSTTITARGAARSIVVDDEFFSLDEDTWRSPASNPRVELVPRQEDGGVTREPIPVLRWRPEPLRATVDLSQDSARIYFDLFGAAYYFLARHEEITSVSPRDAHDRFPFRESFAAVHGLHDRPVVDELVGILRAVIRHVWPGSRVPTPQFQVRSTHDVDNLAVFHGAMPKWWLRRIAGHARGGRPREAMAVLGEWRGARRSWSSDPANSFEFIMGECERAGLKCEFNFIPVADPTGRVPQGTYTLDDGRVKALFRQISARGHLLGLHASYGSHMNRTQLQQEVEALRSAAHRAGVDQAAWGGRHHFLRWRVPDSARLWNDLGMSFDSSVTFAEMPGFRSGTSFPHRVFDPHRRQALDLVEVPTSLMDATLFSPRYMGLEPSSPEAYEVVERLRSRAAAVGGEFVVLWHNDRLIDEASRRLFRFALTGG